MTRQLKQEVLSSERFAIRILSDYIGTSPDEFQHMSAIDELYPIDLKLYNLTFDVKFSSPTLTSAADTVHVWDFDIRNKSNYCDYLVLLGMENKQPTAVFVVPGEIAPKRHLRIAVDGQSKWYRYQIWGKKFSDPRKPDPITHGCLHCGKPVYGAHGYCSRKCYADSYKTIRSLPPHCVKCGQLNNLRLFKYGCYGLTDTTKNLHHSVLCTSCCDDLMGVISSGGFCL